MAVGCQRFRIVDNETQPPMTLVYRFARHACVCAVCGRWIRRPSMDWLPYCLCVECAHVKSRSKWKKKKKLKTKDEIHKCELVQILRYTIMWLCMPRTLCWYAFYNEFTVKRVNTQRSVDGPGSVALFSVYARLSNRAHTHFTCLDKKITRKQTGPSVNEHPRC